MALNNIPKMNIGNLEFSLIQGGMGVGISCAGLAAAVANEGGAGIIASVGLGAIKGYFSEELIKNGTLLKEASEERRKIIFDELYAKANKLALIEEIRIARRKTNGVIGVNIMRPLSDYSSLVEGAVEAEADIIISGAALPLDLPQYLPKNSQIKLIPIVSSDQAANIICKIWGKRYNRLPDAIIVEGPKAGGHLGYPRFDPKKPQVTRHLDNPDFIRNGLELILPEVISAVNPYEIQSNKKIPIIAAGGIFYGGDIRRALERWNVAGVQMATRFVTTNECDASEEFKQVYLNCKEEDLRIIHSPVGLPGRAITNQFLEEVEAGERKPIKCPYHCLLSCEPEKSPYCIANALSSALRGNFQNGYAFCGSNAPKCKEILSIKELFYRLNEEYAQSKISD